MNAQDPQVIEKAMYQMFPPEWVRGKARETGLVKRERKVDPHVNRKRLMDPWRA